VDIHAASRLRSQGELESLGRRLAWDEFSLEGLAARLNSVQWRADEEFAAYGLLEAEITNLKRWAQAWADDINQRIYRDAVDEDERPLFVPAITSLPEPQVSLRGGSLRGVSLLRRLLPPPESCSRRRSPGRAAISQRRPAALTRSVRWTRSRRHPSRQAW
jgi:hypothetical protein